MKITFYFFFSFACLVAIMVLSFSFLLLYLFFLFCVNKFNWEHLLRIIIMIIIVYISSIAKINYHNDLNFFFPFFISHKRGYQKHVWKIFIKKRIFCDENLSRTCTKQCFILLRAKRLKIMTKVYTRCQVCWKNLLVNSPAQLLLVTRYAFILSLFVYLTKRHLRKQYNACS